MAVKAHNAAVGKSINRPENQKAYLYHNSSD